MSSSGNLVDINIDWKQALQDITKWQNQVIRANMKSLMSVAQEVAKDAAANAPVKTGALRDSIHVTATGLDSVTIGSTVPYSNYQELGTSKMKAHPYLAPALMDAIQKYPALFSIFFAQKE